MKDTKGQLRLAVVTSTTPWREMPRMRQQLARQLAREYQVLYVERTLFKRPREANRSTLEEVQSGITVLRTRAHCSFLRRAYANSAKVRSVIDRLDLQQIEATTRQLSKVPAVLLNFQHSFEQVMRSRLFFPKLYICNDDFIGVRRFGWQRALETKLERSVAENATACMAVSEPLLARIRQLNSESHLLLPAHEFEILTQQSDAGIRRTSSTINVCFMGYVNDRVRFDWMRAALRNPRVRLTIIGPWQNEKEQRAFAKLPRVVLLDGLVGPRLYSQLTAMDVFVMPYDLRHPVVRAITAPNKLFQYLACGRPVVISDMPAFMNLPSDTVYRAQDSEDFGLKIERAYAEDSEAHTKERIRIAEANTWTRRGDELLAKIAELSGA